MMYAVKLNPQVFRRICPSLQADFAGRIYGYVDKAHISRRGPVLLVEENSALACTGIHCIKRRKVPALPFYFPE